MARYIIEVGSEAILVRVEHIESRTDHGAKCKLRKIMYQHASDMTGQLFRWDESADAKASQPIYSVGGVW